MYTSINDEVIEQIRKQYPHLPTRKVREIVTEAQKEVDETAHYFFSNQVESGDRNIYKGHIVRVVSDMIIEEEAKMEVEELESDPGYWKRVIVCALFMLGLMTWEFGVVQRNPEFTRGLVPLFAILDAILFIFTINIITNKNGKN